MFASLILCSALLSADPDSITVRVVNTLEEPVAVKFRIVGKEEWIKSELTLDAAQTKNFDLPKGDKYDVVVRDQNKKDLPVGSWDLGKMLDKDPKAEIHIVQEQQKNQNSKAVDNAGSREKLVPVKVQVTEPFNFEFPVTTEETVGDKIVSRVEYQTETRYRTFTETRMVPAGSTQSAASSAQIGISVFSHKHYYPIGEFTSAMTAKAEDKAETKDATLQSYPEPITPPLRPNPYLPPPLPQVPKR